MKIFLTGGAGFIGSHIAESLVSAGHEVTVYDDFSSGSLENLQPILSRIQVVTGDILDSERLADLCPSDTDVISHQAAQLEISKSLLDPASDLRSNAGGTLGILELARKKGIRRIIAASSACVYGQPESVLQTEDHPLRPNWPYGASKLAAEHYCRIYQESYGLEVTQLRYGIVYGPREWYGRALTMFLARLFQGHAPVVFGRGEAVRDLVHVSDVVDFHLRCLRESSTVNEVFNVGTGIGISMIQLAELACEVVTGGELRPVFEEVSEGKDSLLMPTRARTPQELKGMVLSIEKARRLTGYSPRLALKEGIRAEFEWLKQNPHRWAMNSRVKV